MSTINCPEDSLKMIRETLCVAQTHVNLHVADIDQRQAHSDRLQRLIDDIDRQRPLGPDGKHDDRHTATCGCQDVASPSPVSTPDTPQVRYIAAAVDDECLVTSGYARLHTTPADARGELDDLGDGYDWRVFEVREPSVATPDTRDVEADLTARLAAADLGWSREHGDPAAEPGYIRALARQVAAFAPSYLRPATAISAPVAEDGPDEYTVDPGPSVYMCGHGEYVIRRAGMPGRLASFYSPGPEDAQVVERLLNEAGLRPAATEEPGAGWAPTLCTISARCPKPTGGSGWSMSSAVSRPAGLRCCGEPGA